jgi:ferric iron reductase protein FhuF
MPGLLKLIDLSITCQKPVLRKSYEQRTIEGKSHLNVYCTLYSSEYVTAFTPPQLLSTVEKASDIQRNAEEVLNFSHGLSYLGELHIQIKQGKAFTHTPEILVPYSRPHPVYSSESSPCI